MKSFLKTAAVLGVTFSLLFAPKVFGVTGADFQAGRIIDDGVFYDPDTMSVAEIQDFLEDMLDGGNFPDSANGSCDSDGSEFYGGITRAQFNQNSYNNGGKQNLVPFVCLPSYREKVTTGVNNYYEYNDSTDRFDNITNEGTPGGAKSAAQIIYDVSQEHGINPQVLIVLLQKEMALVTDDWAQGWQYYKATGYACPDTGPCNPQYAGFYKQVWNAARQFIRYRDNPNSYNHIAGQNNNIRWNPNASCGSSTVFIENQATAGLYNYTPYRPNSAALNNLYGSGNSCSAYGNRNFWRMFNDWFGPSIRDYNASVEARLSHRTSSSVAGPVAQGQKFINSLKVKNTGTVNWYDWSGVNSAPLGTKPVILVTDSPLERTSVFGELWGGCKCKPNRYFSKVYESDGVSLSDNQHMALPGEYVEWEIEFMVPVNAPLGTYREVFRPMVFQQSSENFQPLAKAFFDIEVINATYHAKVESRASHRTSDSSAGPVLQGEQFLNTLRLRNTGTAFWYDANSVDNAPSGSKPVYLKTDRPLDRTSAFGEFWGACQCRPSANFTRVYESDGVTLASDQHLVKPGQKVEWDMLFKTPLDLHTGLYREHFSPVLYQSSQDQFSPVDKNFFDIEVNAAIYSAEVVKRLSHRTSDFITGGVNPGDNFTNTLRIKNIGNINWYDNSGLPLAPAGFEPVFLVTDLPLERASLFGSNWGTCKCKVAREFTRVYELDGTTLSASQDVVSPGQFVEWDMSFNVPLSASPGLYRELFKPILFHTPNGTFSSPDKGFFDIEVL